MKCLKKSLKILFGFFAFTIIAYWFNLDTKLVKAIEKPMIKHYDDMKRDHRL